MMGRQSGQMGMYVGENESAKYWATILNGLRNCGMEDIFIACTDSLTGFSTAIEAVFPKTEVRNGIIRTVSSTRPAISLGMYPARIKRRSRPDLKAVYAAVDEIAALDVLEILSEHWDRKYP